MTDTPELAIVLEKLRAEVYFMEADAIQHHPEAFRSA